MAASTIPSFTAALLAALQARAALKNVSVCDGPPDPGTLSNAAEIVCIADASGHQTSAALGQLRREENYTQTVWISVVAKSRSDQTTINERAFTLASEIEDEVRTNRGFGITNLIAQISGPFLIAKRTDGNVREAYVEVSIAVQARI